MPAFFGTLAVATVLVSLGQAWYDRQVSGPSEPPTTLAPVVSATPQAIGHAQPAPATPTPGPDDRASSTDRLPDLQTTFPDEIYVERAQDGTRRLRFSTTVMNTGEGPIEIRGETLSETEGRAFQIVWDTNGGTRERPAGGLSHSETHGHWHLNDFALFELIDVNNPDTPVSTQNKITFCLLDEVRIEPAPAHVSDDPAFLECDWRHQGISVGWQETYRAILPEQWVVLDGVPDGTYALRITVDPENNLRESNEDNNEVLLFLEISGDEVQPAGRPPGFPSGTNNR